MQWLTTFVLVVMAWIFFRADTINEAIYVIKHSLSGVLHPGTYLLKGYAYIKFWKFTTVDMFVLSLAVFLLFYVEQKSNIQEWLQQKPVWFRWNIYFWMTVCIILFGVFDSRQFIYFQF